MKHLKNLVKHLKHKAAKNPDVRDWIAVRESWLIALYDQVEELKKQNESLLTERALLVDNVKRLKTKINQVKFVSFIEDEEANDV